jgi:DNA-binding beta-propeller fold protein YncE
VKIWYAVSIAALLCGSVALVSQRQPPSLRPDTKVGPVEDGGFLLPSGWTLRPAGRQVPLQTLPLASVLTPDKKSVLILQSGYNTPVVSLHSLPAGEKLSAVELKDSFHGIVMHEGNVYVGGGSTGAVHQIRLDGTTLKFVGSHVVEANPPAKVGSFIGDLALARDGKHLYAADITQNVLFTLELATGKVVARTPTARMPYRLLLHPSRDELLVSSWIDAEVVRHSTADGTIVQRLPVGAHPTDMLWEPGAKPTRLFVAAAHTNDVYVIDSSESGALNVKERLNVALAPRQPLGMTPSGLAYDA